MTWRAPLSRTRSTRSFVAVDVSWLAMGPAARFAATGVPAAGLARVALGYRCWSRGCHCAGPAGSMGV